MARSEKNTGGHPGKKSGRHPGRKNRGRHPGMFLAGIHLEGGRFRL